LAAPYRVVWLVIALLISSALLLEPPAEILRGLGRILTSRGVLITDYLVLGSPGSALVNAALVGALSLCLMLLARVPANGAILMAIWLNMGFALFGKNVLNMLPLVAGVWLYAQVRREPFSRFSLVALLSATLAPVVSEIALNELLGWQGGPLVDVLSGTVGGILIGFCFPPIAAYVVRVHGGYNLYNMGMAGGLISTVFVASLHSMGISLPTSLSWATEHNRSMALLLYALSALLLALGLGLRGMRTGLRDLWRMSRYSGRLISDFYLLFGDSIYVNMGLLCAVSTTLVLALGGDLSGPAVGGILTITGFGGFGKHLRNITPVLAGAVLSSWLNQWDLTSPANMLAILFSTGLAPVAGQFGPLWGLVAGFLHVRLVHHVGYLSNGLNLYNNGFAAGFVVMFLLPLIALFRKEREDAPDL